MPWSPTAGPGRLGGWEVSDDGSAVTLQPPVSAAVKYLDVKVSWVVGESVRFFHQLE